MTTKLEVDKCVICYDGYTEEDVQTITYGCGHKFHSTCLFGWIDATGRNDNSSRCPQCRQTVIKWPERVRPIPVAIVIAIQRQLERQHWTSYIVAPCLLMVVFLLLCVSSAFITMQIGPTTSYDNTSQFAVPLSSSPMPLNNSLLAFIHNNYRQRSCSSRYGQFFHPVFIIETDIFYSYLYGTHLVDTTLRIFSKITVLLITIPTFELSVIISRAEVIVDLMAKEVLFLRQVYDHTRSSPMILETMIWNHTNRPYAIIRHTIEYLATVLVYICHTITIAAFFILAHLKGMLNKFHPIDAEYSLGQTFRFLNLSIFDAVAEIYKCDGILSLRIIDASPDLIIRFLPVVIFIFMIPVLYDLYRHFYPRN